MASKLESIPFNEKEIKERYLLPFVPSFLYGVDDFKVVSVHKEVFDTGVSRSVIVYLKKDVDHPGKFLELVHYDDWIIPEEL